MEKWSKTSNTSERLKEAMQIANMKQTDLAKATGLGKGGISNYVLGRYEPKSNIISILAEALNVDPVWLMGYDVPMERKKSSPDKVELTEGEKVWLELYHQLSNDTRVILVNMAEAFENLPADKQKFLLDAVRVVLDNQK